METRLGPATAEESYKILASRLSEKTLFESDPNVGLNSEEMEEIVRVGKPFLGLLVGDLQKGKGWWTLQAVWIIAEDLAIPVKFLEEDTNYSKVLERTLIWAEEHGYNPDELAESEQ